MKPKTLALVLTMCLLWTFITATGVDDESFVQPTVGSRAEAALLKPGKVAALRRKAENREENPGLKRKKMFLLMLMALSPEAGRN